MCVKWHYELCEGATCLKRGFYNCAAYSASQGDLPFASDEVFPKVSKQMYLSIGKFSIALFRLPRFRFGLVLGSSVLVQIAESSISAAIKICNMLVYLLCQQVLALHSLADRNATR